jgi:hypothetical protein
LTGVGDDKQPSKMVHESNIMKLPGIFQVASMMHFLGNYPAASQPHRMVLS